MISTFRRFGVLTFLFVPSYIITVAPLTPAERPPVVVCPPCEDCPPCGVYPSCTSMMRDFDEDGDVDLLDYKEFAARMDGPTVGLPPSGLRCPLFFNSDADCDLDLLDFAAFQRLYRETPPCPPPPVCPPAGSAP